MASPQIKMYTARYCGFCQRARALLRRKGVTWSETPVEGSIERRLELVERSGKRSVPQIWIGQRHVGGFDELLNLERSGKLDALLADDDATSAA